MNDSRLRAISLVISGVFAGLTVLGLLALCASGKTSVRDIETIVAGFIGTAGGLHAARHAGNDDEDRD